MKKDTAVAILAAALLTGACGYSIQASTDYDHSINFASYKTFSVTKGSSSGNPLCDQRIGAAVSSALTAKGWQDVPDGGAQATVVVHTSTKTKHTYQTFYEGFGGGWRWRRFGGFTGATTYEQDYKVGTVVVDIFDAKSKEAIWHGNAAGVLSGKATENARIDDRAVAKMFANFPPGTAASASSAR